MIPLGVLTSSNPEKTEPSTEPVVQFLYADRTATIDIGPPATNRRENVPLGDPSANRFIIVMYSWWSGGSRTASRGCTVNGVPLNLDRSAGASPMGSVFYSGLIPDGPSATVICEVQDNSLDGTLTVWSSTEPLYYTGSSYLDIPVGQTYGSTTVSTAVSSGYIFGGFTARGTALSSVWSGITEEYDLDVAQPASGGSSATAGSHEVSLQTSVAVSIQTLRATFASYASGVSSPDILPNLRTWLNSSTLSGIEGSQVSAWVDSASRAWAPAATQPTLTYSGSTAAVKFTGAEFLHNTALRGLNTSQTIFAVIRPSISEATERSIVGLNTGTGVNLTIKSLSPGMIAYGGDWAAARDSNSIALNQWSVVSGRFTQTSKFEVRTKNLGVTSTPTATTSSQDRYTLIGGNGGSASFRGDIAEIIHYSRALNDIEWKAVNNYLMIKHGIS